MLTKVLRQPNGRWSDDLRRDVVIRYLAGERLEDIGHSYGISVSNMYQAKSKKWFRDIRREVLFNGAKEYGYERGDI